MGIEAKLPMVLPMYDALNESHHGGVDSHEPSKFFVGALVVHYPVDIQE